ncbi:Mam33p Ecym_8030 [Eremothecium cymbalariae DBVPG|uniref:Mitochondrial acidic protein MAM33 n=1 Tax=Eremothecium cymbalariae (strain CBS 270.75 / DBVPG 7215 / KCTC 17166 / NRRL Y-17582) TaxID=931890 RepID=G8JWV2_ERECY|nr:Hypothetical protein Ecym_8030 [Eremothecium cymbalariae DBVPG\
MSIRLVTLRACKLASKRAALSSAFLRPTIATRGFIRTPVIFNEQAKNLSQILSAEIDLETSDQVTALPQELSVYLNKFSFVDVSKKGHNMAELVRKNGNETVHLSFDVAQVANVPYDPNVVEDSMNGEEEAPEEFSAAHENFANVHIVVVKETDKSATCIELLVNFQEGAFYIDSITPFESAELALSNSAEAEAKKDLVYHGPPFSNLDESLQEAFEIYLESRGINDELVSFISAYSEWKENNEYVGWLQNMKNFFS